MCYPPRNYLSSSLPDQNELDTTMAQITVLNISTSIARCHCCIPFARYRNVYRWHYEQRGGWCLGAGLQYLQKCAKSVQLLYKRTRECENLSGKRWICSSGNRAVSSRGIDAQPGHVRGCLGSIVSI